MAKPQFPVSVKRGHVVVKIYLTPSNGSDQFTVSYHFGGKRVRRAFGDYHRALTEAETVATKLCEGELNVLTLKNEDRLAYVRAVEALKPTGVPLELAALQFAEIHQLLDGAASVRAAVEFFLKKHPGNMPRKAVSAVADELLATKEGDGMSTVYLKDLRCRLGRFAEEFKGPISAVTPTEIEDFLRRLKLSGRSRNNYRRAIGTLFRFAEKRQYLAKGESVVSGVGLAKEEETEIEIFTPEELRRLLSAAEPEMIPFLAIGAFAGLRHAEIQRLDWSEVPLEDGFIEIKAGKAKTASRRLVPVLDNLKLWLQPHWKPTGPVCGFANVSKQILRVTAAVDETWRRERAASEGADSGEPLFRWKHNALRHSFISYRVAAIQSVAQVALEAGNSPQMIFRHYRELVRPADAAKWFGILPQAAVV